MSGQRTAQGAGLNEAGLALTLGTQSRWVMSTRYETTQFVIDCKGEKCQQSGKLTLKKSGLAETRETVGPNQVSSCKDQHG